MFNLEIGEIPKNKIVKIYNAGDNSPIIKQPLIMDDEISITASSKFGELWQASPNNFLTLLSSSFGTPSGQFGLQGVQIWQSTDPINLNFKVSLEMDTDPYKDVIEPSITLIQTCLPTEKKYATEKDGVLKTISNNLKLKTLIPPGPNIQAMIKVMSDDKPNEDLNKGARGVYDIYIGFIKLTNVLITKVEPTYSKTYAESPSKRNLYPCRVELNIDITTMEIATTDMLTSLLTGME